MIKFLSYAIRLCAVFLFGSTGETISQKGGHLNLGIPGIMAMGVAGGALGAKIYLTAIGAGPINGFLGCLVPFIFALLFGAFFGVIFSFFCVNLKSNQNVVGLVLSTFGVGLAILFIKLFQSEDEYLRLAPYFSNLFFKPGAELNGFEQLFLSYGFLVYLSIILSILAAVIMRRTRIGMNLRAVGENPAAADAAGLNVNRYRYLSTIIGCAIAALSGLFYFMDKSGGVDAIKLIGEVEDFGWMAVALVIFSMWRPDLGVIGAIVFSVLYTVPSFFRAKFDPLNELIALLPYVVTVIVLIITSIFFKRASQAPKSLGTNYFREDR